MMTLNKIFVIIFAAVLFFPIIILVGMAIRNIKDEKKTELKSHLNFLEIFFFVLIESLLFILMISLFHKTVGKFGLLAVITITILLSIDGPIAVTHLIYYFKRTVYWDKKKNQLLVEKLTYSFTIDLQSSNTKILLYDPPIKGGGKGFPGLLLVISKYPMVKT